MSEFIKQSEARAVSHDDPASVSSTCATWKPACPNVSIRTARLRGPGARTCEGKARAEFRQGEDDGVELALDVVLERGRPRHLLEREYARHTRPAHLSNTTQSASPIRGKERRTTHPDDRVEELEVRVRDVLHERERGARRAQALLEGRGVRAREALVQLDDRGVRDRVHDDVRAAVRGERRVELVHGKQCCEEATDRDLVRPEVCCL